MNSVPQNTPSTNTAPTTDNKSENKPLTKNQILAQYNDIKQKYTLFFQKALEIEQELVEHNLVASTLANLKNNRKCFRKIGGVLVEKDSDTVKKDLEVEIANIKQTLDIVYKSMKSQEDFLADMNKKYGEILHNEVKTKDDKKKEESKSSGGVLV